MLLIKRLVIIVKEKVSEKKIAKKVIEKMSKCRRNDNKGEKEKEIIGKVIRNNILEAKRNNETERYIYRITESLGTCPNNNI